MTEAQERQLAEMRTARWQKTFIKIKGDIADRLFFKGSFGENAIKGNVMTAIALTGATTEALRGGVVNTLFAERPLIGAMTLIYEWMIIAYIMGSVAVPVIQNTLGALRDISTYSQYVGTEY